MKLDVNTLQTMYAGLDSRYREIAHRNWTDLASDLDANSPFREQILANAQVQTYIRNMRELPAILENEGLDTQNEWNYLVPLTRQIPNPLLRPAEYGIAFFLLTREGFFPFTDDGLPEWVMQMLHQRIMLFPELEMIGNIIGLLGGLNK